MSRVSRAVATALAGAALVAGIAASPAASASENSAASNAGWTSITQSGGQTFSYHDTSGPVSVLSGSFDWTADFNARLESRHYTTPNFGTHVVHLNPAANCTRDEHITVELYAEAFPGDAQLGSRVIPCASGGDAVFDAISPDTFYFVLTAGSWGVTPNRILTGWTTYP